MSHTCKCGTSIIYNKLHNNSNPQHIATQDINSDSTNTADNTGTFIRLRHSNCTTTFSNSNPAVAHPLTAISTHSRLKKKEKMCRFTSSACSWLISETQLSKPTATAISTITTVFTLPAFSTYRLNPILQFKAFQGVPHFKSVGHLRQSFYKTS